MQSPLPLLIAVSIAAGTLAAGARAAERPAQRDIRYEEDWSVLGGSDPLASSDPFDALKWISLGDSAALSFGGQLRERIESWDGFAFGAPSDDDDVLFLTRLRLHADLHVGDRFRVFVEGKAAFSSEPDAFDGRRATDSDTIDLQNGFLEWRQPLAESARLTARVGRQELRLGKQRLVSPLDWANARRTFDGGSLRWERGSSDVVAFAVLPVRVRPYERNDHVTGSFFYGIQGGRGFGSGDARGEIYAFGLERETAAGDERRHTLGARGSSTLADTRFDLEGEAAWQFGHVGPEDISAGMVSTQLGYWIQEWRTSPRFFLGADWASGDRSAGGDVALFDQLFPLAHAYFGIADVIARQNVIAASGGVTLRPHPALVTELAFHHFRRAGPASGMYAASGSLLRAPTPGADRSLGEEIDLILSYKFDTHVQLGGGYAHFFPGPFLEETGPSESLDFLYLVAQYTF